MDAHLVSWRKQMQVDGHRFAKVTTIHGHYDRAAVVGYSDTTLTVEYPRKKKGNPVTWNIVRDHINQKDVVSIKWYRD